MAERLQSTKKHDLSCAGLSWQEGPEVKNRATIAVKFQGTPHHTTPLYLKKKKKKFAGVVDDGTGTVECIRWLKGEAEYCWWEPPKFGQFVIAIGTIDPQSSPPKRRLIVSRERFPTDPNEELLCWAEALRLGKDCYKLLCTKKKKMT